MQLIHGKIWYWNPVLYGGQLGSSNFSVWRFAFVLYRQHEISGLKQMEGFHWSASSSCFCRSAMLIGKEFHVKLTWKQKLRWFLLEERSKLAKLVQNLICPQEVHGGKRGLNLRYFVILEVHRIDFIILILVLLIYLWERKKLVPLFYPRFLDAYILAILTIITKK